MHLDLRVLPVHKESVAFPVLRDWQGQKDKKVHRDHLDHKVQKEIEDRSAYLDFRAMTGQTDDPENPAPQELPVGMDVTEQTALPEFLDDQDLPVCQDSLEPQDWTVRRVSQPLVMMERQEKREMVVCLVCLDCLDHQEETAILERKVIEAMSDLPDHEDHQVKLEFQEILELVALDPKEIQVI